MNPANQECEVKLTLDPPAYLRLLSALEDRVDEVTQRNLFLDTPDRQLSALRWALRLRREDRTDEPTRLIVTVKGPATRVAGAVQRTEVEGPAELALWQRARSGGLHLEDITAPPRDQLRRSLDPHAPLVPVLDFENHRTTFRLELGGEERLVELDRTQYPTGEIDHELELEIHAPQSRAPAEAMLEIHAVSRALEALLHRHGIQAVPSETGKYSRALRYSGQ